jgi:hypothetical protein
VAVLKNIVVMRIERTKRFCVSFGWIFSLLEGIVF